MKLNDTIRKQIEAGTPAMKACVDCCRKALALIENVKAAVFAEFKDTLGSQQQMLRLALNEAEALAWQTAYPQLVFATLAAEKAQAVANWNAHQQRVANYLVAERQGVRR
jgi:hypothetical protein